LSIQASDARPVPASRTDISKTNEDRASLNSLKESRNMSNVETGGKAIASESANLPDRTSATVCWRRVDITETAGSATDTPLVIRRGHCSNPATGRRTYDRRDICAHPQIATIKGFPRLIVTSQKTWHDLDEQDLWAEIDDSIPGAKASTADFKTFVKTGQVCVTAI
jgi:hypothetical protein